VPKNIDSYIETASKTRAALIAYGLKVNAKSMIDESVKPQRTSEVIAYLPRVLQVALFAPFPSSWLTNFCLARLVAMGEMSIFYLCVPGIFMLLIYNRRPPVLMALYFACFFLLIYGFTQANLGTLYRYRYRYGYWFVMLTLGLLGYCTWLDKRGRLKGLLHWLSRPALLVISEEALMLTAKPSRKEAISSGSAVMGLTLLTFMGFFLRDIMMAQTFGLGPVLDSFFVVLLIPMFIVTVLCMPLGLAFVPIYLEVKERLKHQASRKLVSRTSFWVIMGLLVICFILYLTGSIILPILSIKGSLMDIPELISLFDITLPILLFSGIVILGNSVLNANGRAVLSSAAQLVVPISTILALLLFGSSYGVKVVIYGMVIGQLLNLLIVQYYLKFYDISLLPRLDLGNHNEWIPLILQYLPLVMSAFFATSAAPVATLLAISLPEGAISALNLGNKVVFFVTGLLGTAISTVMLPYFSELIIKKHMISARRELSFFVLFSTFVSVPICIVLFVESELIIRLMFEGRAFSSGDTKLVARVMQYAVIQIPFFVCNSILLKFAIATKHVFATSIVAFLGLLVNIGASIFLIKYMGVGGIALGASVSMLFSTVILVLVLVRYWHISKFDALVMFLNWLLFVTFLMCLHFESITGSRAIFFAYAILLMGYFRSLTPRFFSKMWLKN
jgi:putative peptidoglycan lipid II flippase